MRARGLATPHFVLVAWSIGPVLMDAGTPDYSAIDILIVDDNRHMLTLMRSMLRAIGFRRLHESNDASEAFEIVKDQNVDLIITDLKMAPLDGMDFVRLLRTAEDSPDRFVPVIMLTAYTERRVVEEARDAGVTEFLAKPVEPRKLLHRVWSVIENPREFVRTQAYFGPDRRRRNDPNYRGPERRGAVAIDTTAA